MPVNPISLVAGSVAIDGRPILRHIDLEVPDGQFVALMGANGSGKSTLVKTLVGLLPMSSGALSLFGTPLAEFRDWKRVGFVPQRASAATGVPASVWEVVAAGRLSRRLPFARLNAADRAAMSDALEVVGLADRARATVSTLSGGQQQRVLIARALAGEPSLFFLDEPTAGVDLHNQEALASALGALKQRGVTIVLVAHELGPLAPLIDRAVVLRTGMVVHDGAPLADHEVHDATYGEAHSHHHTTADHHDHAPHVASPLDGRRDRQRGSR